MNQIFSKLFFQIKIFLDPQFKKKQLSDPNFLALHFFSNIFFEPKIFLQTEIFLGPKIFRQKILSLPKRFLNQKFFGPKILFQNLFQTQNVWNPNFFLKIVLDAKFMKPFQAEHFRLKSCYNYFSSSCVMFSRNKTICKSFVTKGDIMQQTI